MRSVYFSEKELECRCCGKVDMDPEFLSMLDNLRVAFGGPLVLNSAFRCPTHNAFVGGVPNSAHTFGRAVDIRCNVGQTRFKLIGCIMALGFKRVGVAKGFIHVDNDPYLPQRVMWMY